MLRKVRHLGRKAAKYHFVVTLNQIIVKGTKSWQPHKLAVALSRRKRKVNGTAQSWRPSIEDPYKGCATWSGLNQHRLEFRVTLFEAPSFTGYDPKNWVFTVENEARDGKRKPIATVRVDIAQYVNAVSASHDIELLLKPLTAKVKSTRLTCSITCNFLSAGPATEADLVSLAGSTASEDTIRLGDIDVANLQDLDNRDFDSSHRSSFVDDSNENSILNQQELRNLTSQIQSLNFAIEEENADCQVPFESESENRKPRSRHSSVRSASSNHLPRDAPSQTPIKGRPNSEVEIPDENSSDLSEEIRQRSSTSDSSNSSFQKRRLRPSADFLPTAYNESEISSSSAHNSPAPKVQKSLLRWCQRITSGYEGVKVTNFTTSWRNGLALCALLHHYKPEYINYESLNAMDGRTNVKKAVDGFKNLETAHNYVLPSFSISNKNNLVSFLMAVRTFLKDDESPHESADDTSSCDSRSSLPRSHHTTPRKLRGSTRVKLLSDLQEKEMEDDVFSAALDLALEESKNSSFENFPEKSEVFASENLIATAKPDNSSSEILPSQARTKCNRTSDSSADDLRKTSTSEKLSKDSSNSSLDQASTCSTRKSSSPHIVPNESKKVSHALSESNTNDVSFDIVTNTPDKKRANNFAEEVNRTFSDTKCEPKVLEKDLVKETSVSSLSNTVEKSRNNPFDEDVAAEEPTAAPQPESLDEFLSELELKNPFEEDAETLTLASAPKVSKTSEASELDLKNPFSEDEILDKIAEPVSSAENPVKVRPNFISSTNLTSKTSEDLAMPIHLSSLSDETKRNKFIATAEFISEDVEIKSNGDEVSKEILSKSSTENHPEKSPTLDVAVEQFESGDSTKSGIKQEGEKDFQSAVEKLLKSSAERTRKAKALEIIAQTKADMTSSKESDFSEEELKRQEKVKERAQKLIEETRACLSKEKKLKDAASNSNSNGVSITVSSNKINHNSLSEVLSVPPCNTSTPKEQSSVNANTNSEIRSSIPYDQPDFRDQNRLLDSNQDHETNSNKISIPERSLLQDVLIAPSDSKIANNKETESSAGSSSTSNSSPASSVIVVSNHKNESNRILDNKPMHKAPPSVSELLETNTFVDPLSVASERPPISDGNSNQRLEQAPASPAPPTSRISANHKQSIFTDLVNDKQDSLFVNDDAFVDPLSAHQAETPLTENVPNRKTSNLGDGASSSTSVDRKVTNSEDVEKRWSSMVKKSTSSATNDEMHKIENEKRALEAEQRMVDERANEVAHEIQEAKNAGGRTNKRREADLTQEWIQLVNKKNAIVRQQDQLALREEEQTILHQVEKLNEELIPLMQIEDTMKTFAQSDRETKLLEEKVRLVNERDKINQLMNEKEQFALDEEERIQTNISENMSQVMRHDEKCLVM